VAQPSYRSCKIQGLPPELPRVSSAEERNFDLSVHSEQPPKLPRVSSAEERNFDLSMHSEQPPRPRTNRNLFPKFSRSVSEGNQPMSSPSHSNLEAPLVSKTLLETPSIPSLASLFHYQPYSPHETTTGFAAVDPVQGSHDHTGRPEVSNPTPLQLGEVSSSDLTGGHYVHRGKSLIGSSHHSPLHIGTIPL